MYTFNIEKIHDKNTDTDNKIVGGGKVFKVYKVSDFVGIALSESTDMNTLCEYFFAYVIYDKLVVDETERKMYYYELQKKFGELEDLIIKILSRDDDSTQQFSEYISTIFSVTSDSSKKSILIDRSKWEDISPTINLSQGQYLHHLDSVYKKYEGIYHNEREDYKLKKILDKQDNSFRRGYLEGNIYSFHQKIEIRYTELQTIKDSNFFYKTEHFYIQDDEILTKKFITPASIKELLNQHGIEKLIHIYYTYISLKDVQRLYAFRIHLRKAIAEFMCYNNIDIVNLLIFQDILFYKIIKNGASIIYNKDRSVDPVSKPLLMAEELTVQDRTSRDNIDEPSLKHQLFYRYKELEKALRRYYLPHVYFVSDQRKDKHHSAVDIIHVRQITLEDDLCLLDTDGEIIIDKMKSVTTFYKPEPQSDNKSKYQPCQLVRFIYRDESSEEEGSMDTHCIGKISTVNYNVKTCRIELLTIIKDEYIKNFDENMDKLTLDSNDKPYGITDSFIHLFKAHDEVSKLRKISTITPTISFDSIYDTSLLFGEQSSKKCDFNKNFRIIYKDYDLFNEKYDRPVTFSPLVYTLPVEDGNKPKVLFIIPESIQSFRPELKPLPSGEVEEVESVEPNYAYITFTIATNKTLEIKSCNTITECEIAGIFEKNKNLSNTYNDQYTHCILIEEISDDKIKINGWGDNEKLDKLYFSSSEIQLQ